MLNEKELIPRYFFPRAALVAMLMTGPLAGCESAVDESSEVEELVVEYGEDAPEPSAPPEGATTYEVEGAGQVSFGDDVRLVAQVELPGGGAVFFHESVDDPDQHGCSALLPPGTGEEEHKYLGDSCLDVFLALTPEETDIPAAIAGSVDQFEHGRQVSREPLGVIAAGDLPLASPPSPLSDGKRGWYAHSCSGSSGGSSHWINDHCDEGGADHCDPGFLDEDLSITSGSTYKSSYQTGLFCNGGRISVTHYYKDWGWVVSYSAWVSPSVGSGAIFWSTWRGNANWKRRVYTRRLVPLTTEYRHYTKMCAGIADCPLSG